MSSYGVYVAFCGQCGSEAIQGNVFCTTCGTRYEAPRATQAETAPVNETPDIRQNFSSSTSTPKPRSQRFLAVIFIAVAVVGATWWAVALSFDPNSPRFTPFDNRDVVVEEAVEPEVSPAIISGDDCFNANVLLSVVEKRLAEGDFTLLVNALENLTLWATDKSFGYSGEAKTALTDFADAAKSMNAFLVNGEGDDTTWDALTIAYDNLILRCD